MHKVTTTTHTTDIPPLSSLLPMSPNSTPCSQCKDTPSPALSIPVIITTRQICRRTSGVHFHKLKPVQLHRPTTHPPLNRTLNIALLNVRLLLNKTFIINDLILDNNIDCMFLTETWLSSDGPATLLEASPPNYKF